MKNYNRTLKRAIYGTKHDVKQLIELMAWEASEELDAVQTRLAILGDLYAHYGGEVLPSEIKEVPVNDNSNASQ